MEAVDVDGYLQVASQVCRCYDLLKSGQMDKVIAMISALKPAHNVVASSRYVKSENDSDDDEHCSTGVVSTQCRYCIANELLNVILSALLKFMHCKERIWLSTIDRFSAALRHCS